MIRYAIYFAPPPSSPLWMFGSGVIGYDAASGHDLPFPDFADRQRDQWAALTAEPRRYGFHATLKAPFELADGVDEQILLDEVEHRAAALASASLDGLTVTAIGRFIALVPAEPAAKLQALAADVVAQLDHLRHPLSEADRARRLKSPLSARQLAYLDQYGYPYVREEFRFHMTLTGPIANDEERLRIQTQLVAAFDASVPRASPVTIDALSVFRQERRHGRFRIIGRYPLNVQTAA